MNDVKITINGKDSFTKHEPGKLEYYMAYANKTDFLSYEIGLYEPLNLDPKAEVKFTMTPNVGDALEFTGVLYTKKSIGKENNVRLIFVNRYFQKLMSVEPLFGKGLTSEIIASFYRKTGVPNVTKDDSTTSVDNIIFPRTTRVDEAITYLLNRSTAANDSYLLGTIIGETAYIRSVKKGIRDIKGGPGENDGGLYYQPVRVRDDRRRVDIMGGINMSMSSDADDVDTQSFSSAGTNVVKNKMFYGITDKGLAKARARVKQLKIYYGSYSAILSCIGWIPLIGANLVVDDKDVATGKNWFQYLDRGKYFINSQVLQMNFKENTPKTMFTVQLIDDKV